MALPKRLSASGLDLSVLRTNDTLPVDAWKEFDRTLQRVFAQRSVGIQDLIEAGLTHQLGGLGSLVSIYHMVSDMNAAEVSMLASADTEQARFEYEPVSVPIPVIFKEFQLDRRLLESSRRLGDGVDVSHAAAAARVVTEKLEDLLFNGNTTVYGGMPIYGYRTHPSRNTAAGADWGTTSNIHANVLQMLVAMDNDNVTGPFFLYIAPKQFREMHVFIDASNTLTAIASIREIFPEITAIKRAPAIPAGQAVLVSMTNETVDLAIAEDLMVVEWEEKGGLTSHHRVMTALAPRVKSDYDGRSGIFHMTGI